MPSKPNILILGPSGSGKTSSLEALFHKHGSSIAFLDLERKGLPFLYDTTKLAQFSEIEDYDQAQVAFTKAKNNPAVKILIYDSFTTYADFVHQRVMKTNTGWAIWDAYSLALRNFLEFNKSTGKIWAMTGIDEVVYIEQAEASRVSRIRCAVQGKKLEGKIEQHFLCVLHCTAVKDKSGAMKHVFRTCTDSITSAKAPKWLALEPEMPNDLCVIIDKLLAANL